MNERERNIYRAADKVRLAIYRTEHVPGDHWREDAEEALETLIAQLTDPAAVGMANAIQSYIDKGLLAPGSEPSLALLAYARAPVDA